MMHLWASGRVPYIASFKDNAPLVVAQVLLVTYWRELHFYWCAREERERRRVPCPPAARLQIRLVPIPSSPPLPPRRRVHRAMHPWWDRKNGLADGDVGAFLYRWAHSLHQDRKSVV